MPIDADAVLWVCRLCGVEAGPSAAAPPACPICQDLRVNAPAHELGWRRGTKLSESRTIEIVELEPTLWSLTAHPQISVGHHALLVVTPDGNLLWDALSVVTPAAVRAVRELGGIAAVAISHPHFQAAMVSWSTNFGGVPVYVHNDDRQWVARHDELVRTWTGDTLELFGGLTVVRCGGHFDGSAVLHWPGGASGRGVLLTSDTISVVPGNNAVSFMYSYPGLLPLDARSVEQIGRRLEPFTYDRLYGCWRDNVVAHDAMAVVAQSIVRYTRALQHQPGTTED
jgi:hypothetical protein